MYQLRRMTVSIMAVMVVVLTLASACVPVRSELVVTEPTTESPVTEESAPDLRAVPVENVTIEVGVGSPIPVDLFVSGGWPDLCAQLAEMEQRMEDFRIDITLLATPADPDCPPDYVGLPFRLAIPLNVVELPEGTYTATVNGVTTTFDLPVQPPAMGDAATDEPAADEQTDFEAELERVLLERDYEQMQAVMGEMFIIAGWRSEGSAYEPEAAAEQLRTNYLGQETAIAFQPVPDSLRAEVEGVFGPDVDVADLMYVTGWGSEGEDEAILYIARRPDGSLYWHGALVAPGGFDEGN